YVVARDDVLRRNLHSFLLERNTNDALDGREDQDQARTLGLRTESSEVEHNRAFVLRHDFDTAQDPEDKNDNRNRNDAYSSHTASCRSPRRIVSRIAAWK